jgi:hypothetical protein
LIQKGHGTPRPFFLTSLAFFARMREKNLSLFWNGILPSRINAKFVWPHTMIGGNPSALRP